jgi:uncharacterized membrane protein
MFIGFAFIDFALIIVAIFLIFLKTTPGEFGYIARVLVGMLSMILAVVVALHCNNMDITAYGASEPMGDQGLYYFFWIVAALMFVYTVPLTILMYIIERTGWLVAPAEAAIEKSKRAISHGDPYYSQEEIIGEEVDERPEL